MKEKRTTYECGNQLKLVKNQELVKIVREKFELQMNNGEEEEGGGERRGGVGGEEGNVNLKILQ